MTQLLPCPSCARHVRRTEASCPFCSAAISLGHLPARSAPKERIGRSATLAFGAAVATSLAACSSPAPTPGNDAATSDAAAAADTGGSEADGGQDSAVAFDANVDTGTPVAAYGGPMFDTGAEDQDAGADTGGPTTLYGGPGT
jgi:hypothetical protein